MFAVAYDFLVGAVTVFLYWISLRAACVLDTVFSEYLSQEKVLQKEKKDL